MRAFLIACAVAIVLAVGGIFGLNMVQRSTAAAYATDGARINPKWSWRQLLPKKGAVQHATMTTPSGDDTASGECEVVSAYSFILADFSSTGGEAPGCTP